MTNTYKSEDCNATDQTSVVSDTTRPKRNIGTWQGCRPFTGAINAYIQLMRQKLEGCIKYVNASPTNEFAQVRVLPNQVLEVCLDDETTVTYKFHSVHYGPFKYRDGTHWKSRYNIYENLQIYPPFRVLQLEMLNRGYFLVDESDPDKSKRMVIMLYKTKPSYPRYLWHGYGVIPGLGNVTPQVEAFPSLGEVDQSENDSEVDQSENDGEVDQSANDGEVDQSENDDDGEADEKGDN